MTKWVFSAEWKEGKEAHDAAVLSWPITFSIFVLSLAKERGLLLVVWMASFSGASKFRMWKEVMGRNVGIKRDMMVKYGYTGVFQRLTRRVGFVTETFELNGIERL